MLTRWPKRPHALLQQLLQIWLQAAFGTEYVEMKSPIDVSAADYEPEAGRTAASH